MGTMTKENIVYGGVDDALRQFDLYWPVPSPRSESAPPPLICFVHGGAWRSEDKRDHARLARSLVAATACPVAVPNYRLTPPANADPAFHHPIHAEDILSFLRFLSAWHDPPASFDSRSLFLLGHSCSAHMLASIFLDSSAVTPSLSPGDHLLRSVKAIILSEGIYDIDALLASFPAYRDWFIQPTFGPSDSYARFSVLAYPLCAPTSFSWLLLHSKGDSLVDLPQTEAMHNHLLALSPQAVFLNTDELTDEHNDILRTDVYVKIVSTFIAKFI